MCSLPRHVIGFMRTSGKKGIRVVENPLTTEITPEDSSPAAQPDWTYVAQRSQRSGGTAFNVTLALGLGLESSLFLNRVQANMMSRCISFLDRPRLRSLPSAIRLRSVLHPLGPDVVPYETAECQ